MINSGWPHQGICQKFLLPAGIDSIKSVPYSLTWITYCSNRRDFISMNYLPPKGRRKKIKVMSRWGGNETVGQGLIYPLCPLTHLLFFNPQNRFKALSWLKSILICIKSSCEIHRYSLDSSFKRIFPFAWHKKVKAFLIHTHYHFLLLKYKLILTLPGHLMY